MLSPHHRVAVASQFLPLSVPSPQLPSSPLPQTLTRSLRATVSSEHRHRQNISTEHCPLQVRPPLSLSAFTPSIALCRYARSGDQQPSPTHRRRFSRSGIDADGRSSRCHASSRVF